MVSAFFGAHTSNLAAISAAICTGPDTHPDPAKRWLVGPFYAVCYLIFAAFSAALIALIAALPPELIKTVAGLALHRGLRGRAGLGPLRRGQALPGRPDLRGDRLGPVPVRHRLGLLGPVAGLAGIGLDARRHRLQAPADLDGGPGLSLRLRYHERTKTSGSAMVDEVCGTCLARRHGDRRVWVPARASGLAGRSPEGVPIALESIDGAARAGPHRPDRRTHTAASDRKVELVGASAEARYRVRGYLSTETDRGRAPRSPMCGMCSIPQKRRANA